ncbi:MAG: hypothetical protein LQ352_004340 [Teloschistes flavicans]|nr:MAG: hypothetical protein LQ352_004340 [Teloschistes flavicans]
MASPKRSPPWYSFLTLDLLLHVGSYTIFHPFVAAMFPLCLRALAASYNSTPFIVTSAYAIFVSLCHVLSSWNQRWAYGPPRKVKLLDEVVVITGGASGLGRCIAEIYAMKGVGVAVMDVGVKEEGENEGVRFYKCDVGDRDSAERVWKKLNEDLGTPTVLINNAAVVNGKPLLSLTGREVENTFRVNTLSHFHLTSLFLQPHIANGTGGSLVTVSSILGRLGASNLSAYTASKASAITFHLSVAAELRSTAPSIKTILVTPGQLDTAMFDHIKLDWFRNFFGPVVEVRELAMRIVRTVDAGEGGTIAMPAYASWIAWQQILPRAVQNALKRWSGVDSGIVAPERRISTETEEKAKVEHRRTSRDSASESESGSE